MLDKLLPERTVIGVLRGNSPELALAHAEAAIRAGLRALEVTFTLPHAADVMSRLHQDFGERCSIGAGTVLTADHVTVAASAGADYLVSPNLNLDVVQAAAENGLPHIPGVLTPTELQVAREAGCLIVKVFPIARVGGPDYIRDLRGPFPDVQVLATGGIGLDDAGSYFAAGARLVGLGALFGKHPDETDSRTRRLLESQVP